MQQRKAYQEIETACTRYVLSQGKDGEQMNDAIWLPPDGHILAATHGRTVLLWDSTDGICLQTFSMQRSRVNALACSPDGEYIALGINRAVVLRDIHSGKYLRTYSDQNWGEVKSLAWSPNGAFLAWTGNPFYAVQVWDTQKHHQVQFYCEHDTHGSASLAWSPDSTRLVTGSCYGVPKESYDIQIWEAQTGRVLSTLVYHTKPIRAVAWSPDGRWIISGGDDGILHVVDTKTGQQRFSGPTAIHNENQHVKVLAWSPDATRIAIGLSDGTVMIQSANLDHVLFSYRCHYAALKRVAWSPDGRQIVSVAYDNSAKIWWVLSAQL